MARTGAESPFAGLGSVNDYGAPAVADWEGDGDEKLLVGAVDGTLHYLERSADGTRFVPRTGEASPFLAIHAGSFSAPHAVDWDGDQDLDLILGAGDGTSRKEHKRSEAC